MSRKQQAATPPLPPGPFDLILADPPWRFSTYNANGLGKSPDRYYDTMSLDSIRRLPVEKIAAADSVLAIWVYGPLLARTFDVIAAWGFVYASDGLAWIKTTPTGKLAFGTGYCTRKGCEQMLLATRGNGLKVVDRGVRQCFLAKRREHSRKPDEAIESLERLFGPVRRIELFARERRIGWTAWGNELPEQDCEG